MKLYAIWCWRFHQKNFCILTRPSAISIRSEKHVIKEREPKRKVGYLTVYIQTINPWLCSTYVISDDMSCDGCLLILYLSLDQLAEPEVDQALNQICTFRQLIHDYDLHMSSPITYHVMAVYSFYIYPRTSLLDRKLITHWMRYMTLKIIFDYPSILIYLSGFKNQDWRFDVWAGALAARLFIN